ncbi:MAG TPA: hypothetical protein VFD82_07850 [Planctomycetota bacterium]|nr:hypothetical protein [Planctomycetota bacterium]
MAPKRMKLRGKVDLYVFVRPKGKFRPLPLTDVNHHPGIVIPDIMHRLVRDAAGRSVTLDEGKEAGQLVKWITGRYKRLRNGQRNGRRMRAADSPDLVSTKATPSCWDKDLRVWIEPPDGCYPVLMELEDPNYKVPGGGTWDVLINIEAHVE